MGKGGEVIERGNKSFAWDEIRQHTKHNDKWLVIEGEVYDISRWLYKHPGGRRVIGHYAGQDATEAFKAFHNDIGLVRKYLKPIRLGQVAETSQKDEELQKDFEELRKTAHKNGYFRPSVLFYTLMVGHILFFELLSYIIMSTYGIGWLPLIGSTICMVIVQAQVGWTQHDFGHLSVFQSSTLNHIVHIFLMNFIKAQASWTQHDFGHLSVFKQTNLNHAFHIFLMCFIKGASGDWWNHMHYQHHAKPNVLDKDPDVRLEALFVLGDTMAKKAAQNKKTMPYNWQHRYFFLTLPPLLFPVYFQIMLFRHLLTRKMWVELSVTLLMYAKIMILYIPLLGFWGFLAWQFVFRVFESHWFVWVSQSNHIPMEIDQDKERSWVPLQLHATCDIEKGPFTDWFTGHLNFQIEHHLFPTMPRHNLYKVAPLVQSLCKKHGVPYKVKTLWGAFSDIVKSLKTSGEVWSHYKDAYSVS